MSRLINVKSGELDLLAEGELSAEQRTALFRRLDEHPTQWKECALAVLEAQAVRSSLRHSLRDRVESGSVSSSVFHKPTCDTRETVRWSKRSIAVVRCAMAASVAFAILVSGAIGHRLGKQPHLNASVAQSQTADDENSRERSGDAARRTEAALVLNQLRLEDEQLLAIVRMEESGNSHFVPIVASPTLSASLLASPLPPLSSRQIRLANQRGWNVVRQRKLLVIERPESEPELVPLQFVRYQFVGAAAS